MYMYIHGFSYSGCDSNLKNREKFNINYMYILFWHIIHQNKSKDNSNGVCIT